MWVGGCIRDPVVMNETGFTNIVRQVSREGNLWLMADGWCYLPEMGEIDAGR